MAKSPLLSLGRVVHADTTGLSAAMCESCMIGCLSFREIDQVGQIVGRYNSPSCRCSAGEHGLEVEGFDFVENSATVSGANGAMAAYFVRGNVNLHLTGLVCKLRDRMGADSHLSCKSIGIRI